MTADKPSLVEIADMVYRARKELQGPATEALERALDAIRVADGSTEDGPRSEELDRTIRHAREVVAEAYGQLRAAETVMWALHYTLMDEHHRALEKTWGSPDAG